MKVALGVDIGGTKIAVGLVGFDGSLVAVSAYPTNAQLGGARVLAAAVQAARHMAGHARVVSVGIGTGGRIDPERGVVLSATDILPGWAGTDIKGGFAEFGVPVAVDNDVNALAAGESRFGAAQGANAVAFIALGTGVGGALVIDGRIHRGAHFSGGEFGHIIIEMSPHARRDLGGSPGTLEAYCSGDGLVKTWREIVGDADMVSDGTEISAAAARDPAGPEAEAIRRTGEYLGIGLTSVVNMFDPDLIVVGGGLSQIGEPLLAPARAVIRDRALPGPSQCPVVAASLGAYAAVIGAACLAMQES